MGKMKITAGRDVLGEFVPKFAELNDDVLTHLAFYVGRPKAWPVFRMAKEIWTE